MLVPATQDIWSSRLKSTIWAYVTAVAFCSSIGGCAPSEDADPVDRDSSRPLVALIMKSLANEFFVNMSDGAKGHHRRHKERYDLIVNGIQNESDLAQQVALIDQMIAIGADAIVIAPADSKAIIPALTRAVRAGIVVINIDNKLDDEILSEYEIVIPFVGPDNRLGSRKVADYLASQLDAGIEVAILEGIPSAYNSQQRRAGFVDAFESAGMRIVSIQSAAWDQTRAAEVTAALLVQFQDLGAIACANDNMALGAISAIERAGRTGNVRVIGFDNIAAARELVRTGKMLATVDQHGDLLAVYGVEFALDALSGKGLSGSKSTPVDLITKLDTTGQ